MTSHTHGTNNRIKRVFPLRIWIPVIFDDIMHYPWTGSVPEVPHMEDIFAWLHFWTTHDIVRVPGFTLVELQEKINRLAKDELVHKCVFSVCFIMSLNSGSNFYRSTETEWGRQNGSSASWCFITEFGSNYCFDNPFTRFSVNILVLKYL